MERLIDADKLWKHKFKSASERMDLDVEYMGGWNDAIDSIVENSATVDPVKHGHWIREPNCWYRCSECGSHYPSIADNMNYHYCPDCGAKMTLD